uniref:Uncharacterized protein n=1 Tax=Pseudomonas fluorescens TaxID=294 RepID=A0A5E6TH86_PSEFL|nr:hypothetical protein PS652_02868 [Pseudomonas fluorescens]
MLGKVANREILAAHQAPAEGLQFTGKVLDQGRLTRTVGAQQADPRTRGELQFDLLEDGLVAVAQTAFGQVEQRAGDFLRLAEDEIERRIDVGRRQLFHALQGLDPALRLAGLGGLGLEPGDVLFHVRALRLLLLVGLLLLRQALGTGALERSVAATVEGQLALLDVGDVINHGIEEIPVVGNQQQRARIAFEPVFQPEDGIQVQVVGRFVEQQQVGRTHQGLGQVKAHPPATGEVTDPAVHLLVGKAQACQQLARPRVGGIAVGAVEFDMQACQCGAVMGGFSRGQVGLDLAQAGIAVEHVVDRQAIEGVDLLAHVRDTPIGRQLTVAGVRRQLTAQQGEQAGFTGAVGTDQAGFLAGVQGHLGAF